VIGLFFGLALAKGLSAAFKAFQLDLPQGSTVFETRTIVVSLLLGILITLAATLSPALRATRVPPIAAVREGATLPPPRGARFGPAVAIVTIVVAVAALAYGSFGNLATGPTLLLIGVGLIALFLGVALLAGRLVKPIAGAVGLPAARFAGVPGRLARDNATRNPSRTATTAAALMIGLALVTIVATLGSSLRSSARDSVTEQAHSDYVVTSHNGFDPFSAAAGPALQRAAGVDVASSVLSDRARIAGKAETIDGVDAANATSVLSFKWKDGSNAVVERLGRSGAIVKKDYAKDHHLRVGSPLTVTAPSGKHARFVVTGITNPPVFDKIAPLLSNVVISNEAFRANFPRSKALYTFVQTSAGQSPTEQAALQQRLDAFPDAKLQTSQAWVKKVAGGIDQLLNLLYVLLALSVIVSLFGMVNTLVLSVFERTRELGMLRAVGMTRRQVRRMVRHESVITALIGAALGLPLGLFIAALVTKALSDQGISFSLPIGSLVIFTIVAVIAGLLAAIFPARRASRINVLSALQYE
jgi:putative ABC transport system permease protein